MIKKYPRYRFQCVNCYDTIKVYNKPNIEHFTSDCSLV